MTKSSILIEKYKYMKDKEKSIGIVRVMDKNERNYDKVVTIFEWKRYEIIEIGSDPDMIKDYPEWNFFLAIIKTQTQFAITALLNLINNDTQKNK